MRWFASELSDVQKTFSCGNASFNAEDIPLHNVEASARQPAPRKNGIISSDVHRSFFWQYIHMWCPAVCSFVPDDREKVVRGSPRAVVFLCRNQEETMKVMQLPSIQGFHKMWIRSAAAWRLSSSQVLEQD
jgi:hypothetical protein